MINIVIAGRPNTGKSTLFNALTHSRDALVHDRPGVTRDIVEGIASIGKDGMKFNLYDTAGLEKSKNTIAADSTKLALTAIGAADAILFVVDGRAGIAAEDLDWARVVKRAQKTNKNMKILLLLNKAESKKGIENLSDFYRLGFGEPLPISAEHKIGFGDIYEWIEKIESKEQRAKGKDKKEPAERRMNIAIMGQPNVGKSTLINQILGEERVIVRDEPGVTRDTIRINTLFMGRNILIMDTAGMRRKAGITDDVETLSAMKALDALTKTDAVILVVDATRDIENQALGIAGRVYDAGKILCVVLNKWDLVPELERDEKLLKLKRQFNNSFSQIVKPLILAISAENGMGVRNLFKRIYELWDISNTHGATSLINRTVTRLIEANQPPMSRVKRRMKIKFAHQTKSHPITVVINVGGASDIPDSYTRYLRKGIAKALKWEQLPVVIEYTKTENPFENK